MNKLTSITQHKLFLPVFFGTIVFFFLLGGIYFFNQYRHLQNNIAGIAGIDNGELKGIVENVSKLMELPQEVPTLATVSDIDKLKTEQTFFQKGQNGDKVLLYVKSKLAVLYRPKTNKIINIGPLNIANPTPTEADTSTVDQGADITPSPTKKPLTIALLNGTKIAGLTRIVEADLRKKTTEDFVVSTRGDTKNDAESTIVVNNSGISNDRFSSLVTAVKGEVGALPEGEQKPTADILIIIGHNYQGISPSPTQTVPTP